MNKKEKLLEALTCTLFTFGIALGIAIIFAAVIGILMFDIYYPWIGIPLTIAIAFGVTFVFYYKKVGK